MGLFFWDSLQRAFLWSSETWYHIVFFWVSCTDNFDTYLRSRYSISKGFLSSLQRDIGLEFHSWNYCYLSVLLLVRSHYSTHTPQKVLCVSYYIWIERVVAFDIWISQWGPQLNLWSKRLTRKPLRFFFFLSVNVICLFHVICNNCFK